MYHEKWALSTGSSPRVSIQKVSSHDMYQNLHFQSQGRDSNQKCVAFTIFFFSHNQVDTAIVIEGNRYF